MSLSKDKTYYKDIATHNGVTYRLYFVPGDVTDLTDPSDMIELPDFLVEKNSVIINVQYADDMPVGLPLISEMKLKLDLKELRDDFINDWSTLRNWILAKKSDSTRTVNSEEIYIPNSWYVTAGGQYLFEGVQDVTSNIAIDSNGILELTCFGMMETALKNTQINSINLSSVTDYNVELIDFMYSRDYGFDPVHFLIGLNEFPTTSTRRFRYYHSTITYAIGLINLYAQNISNAYQRRARIGGTTDNPLNNCTFYKQDETSKSGQKGAVLTDSDLKIILKVLDKDDNEVGGLFVKSKSDASWASEFENAWSLLSSLYEGFLNKGYINYPAFYSGTNIKIESNYIYENTFTSVGSLDVTDFLEQSFAMDNSDVLFQQGVCHVPNVTGFDTNEFNAKNANCTPSNPSFEVEIKLHNQIVNFRAKDVDTIYGNYSETLDKTFCGLDFAILQHIYYYDSGFNALVKVHDWNSIRIDSGTYVTGQDISGDDDLPFGRPYDFVTEIQSWIAQRVAKSSLGYTVSTAGRTLFCNDNQFMIKGTVELDNALPIHLGRMYSIDVDNLLPYSLPSNYDNDTENTILTNISANIQEGYSECTWFLRGDRV